MKFLSDVETAVRLKNVPAGTIVATNVQAAINALDDAIQNVSSSPTAATLTGTGAFPGGGTTDTVTDSFITANTFVVVSPTGTKVGEWSVVASAGSFTVTSDATEDSGATYDWVGIQDGASQPPVDLPFTWDVSNVMTLLSGILNLLNAGLIDNSEDTIVKIKGCNDGNAGGVQLIASNGASGYLEAGNTFFGTTKSGESYSRTVIQFDDGKIGFGPGNATRDTWLYREALNRLKTDETFIAKLLELPSQASIPAAPDADKLTMFSKNRAGRMTLNAIGPSGVDIAFQPALFGNTIVMWVPGTGTTTAIGFGTTWTARNTTGAQAHPAKATTNFLTQMLRATFSSTTAVNTGAGIQSANTVAVRGNAAGIGGFFFFARFGVETLAATGQQLLVGLTALNAVLGGEPSAQNNTVGIGKDAADTNWQLIFRGTAATKVDTGLAVTAGVVLDLYMFCKPNDTKITVRVVRANDGSVIIDNVEYSTNLPANTTFLYVEAHLRNTGTAINALALNKIYVETDV